MKEYGLSPDKLIAKDFRVMQSGRREFVPHGKRDWIAAIKKVYRQERNIGAKYFQRRRQHLYAQGVWIFSDWNKALLAAGFDSDRVRIRQTWDEAAFYG